MTPLDVPRFRPICRCEHPLAASALMPERWPRPCYIGATFAGMGWSWFYECHQYGALGDDGVTRDLSFPEFTGCNDGPTGARAIIRRAHDVLAEAGVGLDLWWSRVRLYWPHPCTHRPQERWQCLE